MLGLLDLLVGVVVMAMTANSDLHCLVGLLPLIGVGMGEFWLVVRWKKNLLCRLLVLLLRGWRADLLSVSRLAYNPGPNPSSWTHPSPS